MAAITDLFPVGEAFAEMDLVVRQLDDGSLTVADDDSLSDEDRLRVSAEDSGLKAEMRVSQAPDLTEGLSKAIAFLNKDLAVGTFVWRGGHVWREGLLAWSGADYTPQQLQGLYEEVRSDAEAKRDKLNQIARGEVEWMAISDRARKQAAPAPPPPSVPPSFLPGSGQRADEDRATLRYGAVGAVPGRSELNAAEHRRRPSVRAPVESSGSNAPLLIAVSFLLLGGLAGLMVFLNQDDSPPPPPVAPPVVDDSPDGDGDGDGDGDDDGDGDGDGDGDYHEPDFKPSPPPDVTRPTRPTPPEPDEPSPPLGGSIDLRSESGVWEALNSPDGDLRKRAVVSWAELHLDEQEGTRLRILRLLKGRMDRASAQIVHKSFRETPVRVEEALGCLGLAGPGLRRLLIEQLGQPEHSPEDAEIIAEMLADYPDTQDMQIELALIRLGHPKPGAAIRMVDKRGVEWVEFGDGPQVLAALAKVGLSHIKPLVSHSDRRVRIVLCKIVAESKAPKALSILKLLVKDDVVEVRRRAVAAMTSLRDPLASWILARALVKEEDRRTKEGIRTAFSKFPSKATAKYLRALYKKGGRENRLAAIHALHAMGKPEAVEALVRALRSKDTEVLMATLTALRGMQKQPSMQDTVGSCLSELRRLALSGKRDKSVRKAAKQLHYAIAGRFPK